jgi:hypothetical protein
MATSPLEMLDFLESMLASAEQRRLRSRADLLTLVARDALVLGCRGRILEVRPSDMTVVFTVKQTRSMLRTLRLTLAAEVEGASPRGA